ncbi:MAG TPA: hypothetical protein VIS28_02475 [Nitrososphaeraceae archaeon]
MSKKNVATVSNISVPSTDKLLDPALGVKGKPGLYASKNSNWI